MKFSFFIIVLLFLLVYKKIQPASSAKNLAVRSVLIFVLFFSYLGPQLRQSFSSESSSVRYSLIRKEQGIFSEVYSDLLAKEPFPYFGVPAALDLNSVSPFMSFDLGATGMAQTYGWPMRLPPIDDRLISIGVSPNPSLALIAGDLALADADSFAPIFARFFFDNYSACGSFDGFRKFAHTQFAYFVRVPRK